MSEALKAQDHCWQNARDDIVDQLPALVSSRLCHDLVSPFGAVGNGVELLQFSPDFAPWANSPEMQLISESIEAARLRINWFRVAFGQAPVDQRYGADAMVELLSAADRHGRIRIRYDAEGDLTRSDARLILLAMMCLETAMPWGGRVLICRGATGWRLLAEAERLKHDPALWAWLDDMQGGSLSLSRPDPSQVQFPLLAHYARVAHRSLDYEMDDSGGEISF